MELTRKLEQIFAWRLWPDTMIEPNPNLIVHLPGSIKSKLL